MSMRHLLGSTHQDVATTLTTLGLIRGTLIDLSQAKPLLERALDIRRSLFGSSDPRVGESLTNLATVLYASGDFVGPIQTLEHSLMIRERTLGPSHPDVAVTLTHLAIAERGLNRLEHARIKAERAMSILQAKQPTQPNDLAMALNVGERATELEVRRLNNSDRLGRAKVISFATHGLLAGEVQGVTQPALVLTPPEVATDDNDGLLSMEDVLQLKLSNTEWVILSACNTGGDDGSGESLSGLARAFFFAGAKALLVSQWSVHDEATRALMAAVFSRYGGTHAAFPAKALQNGMLALLDQAGCDPERQYFAHPYAWAAFFLVGEGVAPI